MFLDEEDANILVGLTLSDDDEQEDREEVDSNDDDVLCLHHPKLSSLRSNVQSKDRERRMKTKKIPFFFS
jgi:hypothetical protein